MWREAILRRKACHLALLVVLLANAIGNLRDLWFRAKRIPRPDESVEADPVIVTLETPLYSLNVAPRRLLHLAPMDTSIRRSYNSRYIFLSDGLAMRSRLMLFISKNGSSQTVCDGFRSR